MAIHPTANIHPTAIVHEDATLGEHVEVGPYAVIEAGVVIGNRTRVMSHSQVLSGTTLGEDNMVHHHAVIGGDPQDLKYDGQPSNLRVGNGNTFREFTNISRSNYSDTYTEIGNNCFFMANTHVGHDCVLENNIIIANNSLLAGHCHVATGAFISGCVTVHQFTKIGRLAMIGGLSAVDRDVPCFLMAVGARPCGLVGANIVGLRRAHFDSKQRSAIQKAFHVFFRSTVPLGETLRAVEEGQLKLPEEVRSSPEVKEIIAFCKASERGVLRARVRSEGSGPRGDEQPEG